MRYTDNKMNTQTRITDAVLRDTFGITVDLKFVPFSQSRSYKKGYKTTELNLNWEATIRHNGRDILTTDYSAGCGHMDCVKNYNPKIHGVKYSIVHADCMAFEAEKGKLATPARWGSKPIPTPEAVDVLYCLVLDSDALEYDFEEWAANFGYDTDSRKAEEIYRACLDIGLKLIRAIGSERLRELRDAFQDF